MTTERITVQVLYFAAARERVGLEQEQVELSTPAAVEDLWTALSQRHDVLDALRAHLRVAVNQAFASDNHALRDGDEIALIPPVSGGAPRCRLTQEPLDVRHVEARVRHHGAGALVTFQGTVRDRTGERDVAHLEYEVYPEMALARLEAICDEVVTRWPACRAAIDHRFGRLGLSEVSVVIAVSSPHRPEAFEACRHAIERIKQDVPIWKKEVGPDGASWVGMGS